MIVVDSNVLACFFLPGDYTQATENLYKRNPDWQAPIVWRGDYLNILAGYMRHGMLTMEQARAIQTESEGLPHGAEHEPDSRRVLELTKTSRCPAYDCELIALAEALDVIIDAWLIKTFPKIVKPLAAV